jgi:serine/threonine protein kinase
MNASLVSDMEATQNGLYPINGRRDEEFRPRRLGPYRLGRRLGAGGMGEVYLGKHPLLRRPCAVKLIRPPQAADPLNLVRFEQEVQAMASLSNWNTVQIYDYGHAEDGTFYYVMEYLAGLNLEDLVNRHGPLLPERSIHFLQQVCGTLREAHGIGLIHCDIKPSNIMACERGGRHDVAKLLDFGIAKSRTGTKGEAPQEALVGSPLFMSPEQASAADAVDARSDLYSLGGVAYFLLTGQPPFQRSSTMQTLVAHVHEPVARPSEIRGGIPHDLEEVVLRCLEKDATLRFQDADSLDKELAKCESAGRWTEVNAASWWQDVARISGHAA